MGGGGAGREGRGREEGDVRGGGGGREGRGTGSIQWLELELELVAAGLGV